MKISYEEFNDLQKQQRIRDYAQDIHNTLICLEQIVERKDKQVIRDFMIYVRHIENKAVTNIENMIEEVKDDE